MVYAVEQVFFVCSFDLLRHMALKRDGVPLSNQFWYDVSRTTLVFTRLK